MLPEGRQGYDHKQILSSFSDLHENIGSPPHPLAYYTKCYEYLKDYLKIFWAEYEGKIIAALLGFAVGRGVHIINTVSDEKHWGKRPNDLCHWNFIKWGYENGYEFFDLGSVRYEGQKRYKEKWGAEFQKYATIFLSRTWMLRKLKRKPLIPLLKPWSF
jgi:lipid II:glycine glycyltransferase (peptidoglycan interpeptide bridge formation enzyme)